MIRFLGKKNPILHYVLSSLSEFIFVPHSNKVTIQSCTLCIILSEVRVQKDYLYINIFSMITGYSYNSTHNNFSFQ